MKKLSDLATELNRQPWAVVKMLKNRGYLKKNGEPKKRTLDSGFMTKRGLITNSGWDFFIKELGISDDNEYVQMDFRKNLLEKPEALVYSLLDFCPIGIGTLMEKLPYQLSELLTILESLESKGLVRENVPNYFVRLL